MEYNMNIDSKIFYKQFNGSNAFTSLEELSSEQNATPDAEEPPGAASRNANGKQAAAGTQPMIHLPSRMKSDSRKPKQIRTEQNRTEQVCVFFYQLETLSIFWMVNSL